MQPYDPTSVFDFSDLIAMHHRNFTGRQWVFAKIDRWLADHTAPQFFVITGEPGIGKTAIAAQVTRRRELAAMHFCIARQADTIDPLNFTRSLSYQCIRIDGFATGILHDAGTHIQGIVHVRENYGQAIAIHIDNLMVQSDSATVAFNRTVIVPLKKLYATGIDQQLLILVDALDEAVQHHGRETIVDLLANAQGLPPQVRFLLTSRPESAALRHFEALQIPYLLLDAGGKENLQDVQEYVHHQLEISEPLQSRLAEQHMPPQQLVDWVTTASRGNFLYVTLLLPDIARGTQRFDTFATLPQGLDSIYREFLRTRKIGRHLDQWRTSYRPVMGILAVAQDTLTRDQLTKYTGRSKQIITDILQELNQFLDPIQANRDMYRLYHQSITDFLQDEERAEEFWIDLKEVHRSLAAGYVKDYASNWQKCDSYGLRYLPVHLMRAGQDETLRPDLSV
jgi:hypothetical protein